MGYNFTIGNAVPVIEKSDFPELRANWEVEIVSLDSAPVFQGDEMTGNRNTRSPSYSGWSNFCRATGLYDFFYNDSGHLRAGHPGCVGIAQEDADFVTAALNRYKQIAQFPPGFDDWRYCGEPRFDGNLARLIWLEFWMQWAVKNCETPAIQNT